MKTTLQCLLVIIASNFLQVNVWAANCAPADNPSAAFICTSQDITIDSLSLNTPPPPYCLAGDTVILDLTANLGGSTNNTRFDVGLYLLESVTDPSIIDPIINDIGATCSLVTAPPSSPFETLDGDAVGDVIGQGLGDGELPITWNVGTVSVLCDPNGVGGVTVQTLVDYAVGDDSIGTGTLLVPDYIPDGGSKCSLDSQEVSMGILGSLTVNKQALPDDGTNFSFSYTNSNAPSSSPTPNPLSPFGLLHSTSSDPIYVDIGTTNGVISVTEAVPSQYLMTGVTCVDTLDASKTVTPSLFGNSFTVDITAVSPQVECTVTNTRKPTVEVEKIWLDASVNDAVSITATGGTNNIAFASVADTSSETDVDATFYVQTAGDLITLAESFTSGVTTNYNIGLSCSNDTLGGTDVSGVTVASPSFTVANQDEIICSYTNTRKSALLTVNKTWINAAVGDNVTISTTGASNNVNFISAVDTASETDTDVITYQVFPDETLIFSEIFNTGTASDYVSDIVCSNSTDVNPNDGLTISAADDGASISCTYTNTRTTLQLNKTVINDNGGTLDETAFTPTIDTNPVIWSTPIVLAAGSHTASEILVAGYTAGSWGGDCAADGTVTLAAGDAGVCTITNDDISPTITVVKTVINDNGGLITDPNAFLLTVDGNAVSDSTINTFDAGLHTVAETNFPGYAAGTWAGDCAADGTITLILDQDATCTITNDDISPTITVVKTVINDNGGLITDPDEFFSDPDVFLLTVDGNAVLDSATNNFDAGLHTVAETNLPFYTASAWGGDCAADGSITLVLDQDATCTITNDDDPRQADLSISKTDAGSTFTPGGPFSYLITVTNNGPHAGENAVVVDALAPWAIGTTWTCTASGGAVCPNLSGTGSINETIATFPDGGELVYVLLGNYSADMSDYP